MEIKMTKMALQFVNEIAALPETTMDEIDYTSLILRIENFKIVHPSQVQSLSKLSCNRKFNKRFVGFLLAVNTSLCKHYVSKCSKYNTLIGVFKRLQSGEINEDIFILKMAASYGLVYITEEDFALLIEAKKNASTVTEEV